jgi:hypothetical protein
VVSAGSAAVRALSGACVWFYCRVCAPGLVSVALLSSHHCCQAGYSLHDLGTTQLLYSEGVGAEALHVCFENYYNCFDAVCKVVMFVLREQ